VIGSFWIRLRRGIERLITGQSLRSRLASLTGISVAAAVLLVGSTAYLSTRISLRDQLDREMLSAARTTAAIINSDIRNLDNLGPGLGTSQELLAVTTSTGETTQAGKQSLALVPEAGEIAVARMQHGHRARSVKLEDGQQYRLVSVPVRARDRAGRSQSYAILYARPLTSLGTTLNSLWLVIALSGLVGILTTTLTALWMAQTALAPVRRLSTAVKNVTQTDQLNPIRIYGRDDLGELTRSFNLMLKSLQTSREQQRQLIADAGHELRTPLTSMRTNIELLVADDKSGMLPEGARSEILDDVSAQLGEFSALVGDLVALTRDDHLQRQPERLDLRGDLRNRKAKVYIALDISGSISDEEFKQAMEQVLQIVKVYNHDITLIECDNEIRRIYHVDKLTDLKERFPQRGGTAFAPVINYCNGKNPDILVYFTDGKGEEKLPQRPKGYSILWLLSGKDRTLSLARPYGVIKKLMPIKSKDPLFDFDTVEKGGFSMANQERNVDLHEYIRG